MLTWMKRGLTQRTSIRCAEQCRLKLLAETLVLLSAAASHADVIRILRNSARRLSGADGIAIILRDGDFCRHVDEDAIAPLWKGHRFAMSRCIAGLAMLQGRTIVVPDIVAENRLPQEPYRKTFVRGLMVVPMLGEATWGAIGAYWARPHTADGAQLHAIEALAHAAGASLRNLDLLKSLHEKQERLEWEVFCGRQLQDISASMIREERPEAFYQRILETAMALTRADGASLQEYVPQRDQLKLLACAGFHPESAAHWEWVSMDSGSSCGEALRTGKRAVMGDVELCEDPSTREEFQRSALRAGQSTPLTSRSGRLMGMISTHWREPRSVSEEELGRLDVLARLAADLIERSQGETALRDSEHHFRSLANAMPHLVWAADPAGRIDFCNRHGRNYAPAQIDADGIYRWELGLHPDDRDAALAAWARAMATGEPYQVEHRIAMADGSYRWHMGRGVPDRDKAGRIVRWYGTATDIHDMIAARESLRALNATLERRVEERTAQLIQSQKMEAIGRLTGGVAHDFNNVLQGIGSCLFVLDRYVPEGTPRHLHTAAQQSVERGARLTRSLLAFARNQRLTPEPTDLGTLLDRLKALLERTLGGQIIVELAVSQGTAPALVDPAQLEAAIFNLAINARDAMPDGGTLTLTAADASVERAGEAGMPPDLDPGAYVAVTVTDTGTGIDEAILAHVFEPFFTTKEVGKGSGLGLAMVHGMAAQSGGGVHIASTPGQGTAVTLYLPRAVIAEQSRAAPVRTASGRGETVLLVDDDAIVRAGVAVMLEGLGYRVLTADSGAEALDLLRRKPAIEAVVTDFAMPEMNGAALVRELRRLHPGLPALLITGYADHPTDLDRTPVLAKPFGSAGLAASLAGLLEAERTSDEALAGGR